MPTPPKLFSPGPVDLFDETLDVLGQPVSSMMDREWVCKYEELLAMLQQVFQTKQDVYIMTGPGSGAIETGLASLFQADEQVVVVRNGMFAERLVQVLDTYRCQVIAVTGPWGEAIDLDDVAAALEAHPNAAGIAVVANETGTGVCNPIQELAALAHQHNGHIFVDAVSAMGGYDIPVDEWGLDVVATSSNKALEMAPGLGIAFASPAGWDAIDRKAATAQRGWYYNLATWRAARERDFFPFPSTPATGLIAGLHASVKRILEVETLQGHWDRYAWAQRVVRTGLANIGFELVAADDVASPTITTVSMPGEVKHVNGLRDYLLAEHNLMISTSGGPLAGTVARIGHMGRAGTREYLLPLLLGIEEFLRREVGVSVPVGASLVGLEAEERWY